MDLRSAGIFCDVVACRSFSKGAEMHEISQSSASQVVHQLEKQLGTQLIDRSKRPFELTAAGEVYYEGCRELLANYRKIEDRLQRVHNRVAGHVRIAAIYSVGLLQMNDYVRRYQKLYPDVELQLEYLHPDEVYSRVIHDESDLGLVSFPRDGGELSSIAWQEQPMVLVVPPEHRLAGKSVVNIEEIDGEQFVGFTDDLTIQKRMERWLKQAHVTVNVVHQFDNIENIKRAVEIGSGISLLPLPTVRRETELGSLCAIGLKSVSWCRPLGIVHRRHKTFRTAVAKFVELLQDDSAREPTPERETTRNSSRVHQPVSSVKRKKKKVRPVTSGSSSNDR
ncbi:MAG: LysR substrate-binding domain-containing protein [Planctomycetaceae bacterium]